MGKCSKTPVFANRLLNALLRSTEKAGWGGKEMLYQLPKPQNKVAVSQDFKIVPMQLILFLLNQINKRVFPWEKKRI